MLGSKETPHPRMFWLPIDELLHDDPEDRAAALNCADHPMTLGKAKSTMIPSDSTCCWQAPRKLGSDLSIMRYGKPYGTVSTRGSAPC